MKKLIFALALIISTSTLGMDIMSMLAIDIINEFECHKANDSCTRQDGRAGKCELARHRKNKNEFRWVCKPLTF